MYLMQKKALKLFHKPAEQSGFLKGTICKAEITEDLLQVVFTPFKKSFRDFSDIFIHGSYQSEKDMLSTHTLNIIIKPNLKKKHNKGHTQDVKSSILQQDN